MEITNPQDAMLVGTALKLFSAMFPYAGGAHCHNEAVLNSVDERASRIHQESVAVVMESYGSPGYWDSMTLSEASEARDYVALMNVITDHSDKLEAMMDQLLNAMIAARQ